MLLKVNILIMKKRNKNKAPQGHAKDRVCKPAKTTNESKAHQHGSRSKIWSSFKKLILWLGSAGFLVGMSSVVYEYYNRDIKLEFVKALSNGYEFTLSNNSPTDQLIESFRVIPPSKQKIIYKITEDIYGTVGKDGVSLPGGPNMYVPAAEFKELDKQIISSKSKIQFRLPPLADRQWLQPEAALIDFEFSTVSRNTFLNKVEKIAITIGLIEQKNTASFLVLNNYWTPVKTGTLKDAIGQACRDNSELSKLEICKIESLK